MEELDRQINDLASKINKAIKKMGLDSKKDRLEELKRQMSAADFWNNPDNARTISTQASNLDEEIRTWQGLATRIADLQILINDQQAEDLFDLDNVDNIQLVRFWGDSKKVDIAVDLMAKGGKTRKIRKNAFFLPQRNGI